MGIPYTYFNFCAPLFLLNFNLIKVFTKSRVLIPGFCDAYTLSIRTDCPKSVNGIIDIHILKLFIFLLEKEIACSFILQITL